MTDREFNSENYDKAKMALKSFSFNEVGRDVPMYKESINNRLGFVNFGADNNMPNYYISLADRSPKHNAIIKLKAAMIGGNGFNKNQLSNEALSFLQNIMNDEDLEEIVAKLAYDLEMFGAFALNVIWSNDRTKISEINYITPQSLRIAAPDSEYPQLERYYISKDWSNINKPQNKPVLYAGFSMRDRSNASQILYCKTYQPGKYFYGVPEYIPGARWIEMEYEISDWHLKNIKNGFSPSMFINFPTGIPTDEEMTLNDKKLMRELAGAKGAGKAFITYSENKDTAPQITPIDSNDNDGKFVDLNDMITEGILGAHRVNDPALFGLEKSDGAVIAGQSQILNSLEMFRAQYIIPKQRFIEKVINRLARINGIQDKIELSEYELNFAKMDISIPDVLSILTSQLSDDSKRSLLIINGYSEDDANKLISTNTSMPTQQANGSDGVQMDSTNDSLKGLSAKENADMYRIVRDFTKGKINEHLALTRLMAYGIDQESARKILGIGEDGE